MCKNRWNISENWRRKFINLLCMGQNLCILTPELTVLLRRNWMQGLSVPFACVGSGDPVRVLCMYTMKTLDIFEAFIAEAYVQLAATSSTVLCSSLTLWDFLLLLLCCVNCPAAICRVSLMCVSHTVLCGALYTACVDASRMVFWDRSVLR